MRTKILLPLALLVLWLIVPLKTTNSYPIDGYERTGIERLLYLVDMDSSGLVRKLPYGGRLPTDSIRLNLVSRERPDSLSDIDRVLQESLVDVFPSRSAAYSISVLDMTPGREIRYAEHRPEVGYQPGSVGKLAVLTAIFCELENVYVDSVEARWDLLKKRVVRSGPFGVRDHHTIPFYDPETNRYNRRQVGTVDDFSLYQWIDHMVSVSNNGAASIVWREAFLMRVFGQKYPTLTQEEADEYFRKTPRRELADIAESVVNEPLRNLGITHDEWRLGQLFTRGGSNIIPPKGGSIGTTRGLMKWLLALESGRVIDAPSSLEMKRLMYMTDRRIRYAHSPTLDESAVYFKSGSFYGGGGGKYAGLGFNYMNSIAIVEHPDGGARYAVALMSNVLGRNSAYAHQVLASKIDRVIREGFADRDSQEATRADAPGDDTD